MNKDEYIKAVALRKRIEADAEFAELAEIAVVCLENGRTGLTKEHKERIKLLRVARDLAEAEKVTNESAPTLRDMINPKNWPFPNTGG